MDKLSVDTTAAPVSAVTLDKLGYGQLMNMARTHNRFVYTGSLTTPPCTEKVYWNVINRVYPIKDRHLGAFQHLI
jgi:carbonic anhydrase